MGRATLGSGTSHRIAGRRALYELRWMRIGVPWA